MTESTIPHVTQTRDELISVIKTVMARPHSMNTIQGSPDVSVLGWSHLLGELGLEYRVLPAQWLDAAAGDVITSATVPTPGGGEHTGQSFNTIPPGKKRHIDFSKAQTFAMRRAMMDAWRPLVLAAGIELGRPDDEADEWDDRKPPAPKQPQQPQPQPQTAQADDPPPDPRILAANKTRETLVNRKDTAQLATYDDAQLARGFRWSDALNTYVVAEGEQE